MIFTTEGLLKEWKVRCAVAVTMRMPSIKSALHEHKIIATATKLWNLIRQGIGCIIPSISEPL